VGPQAAGVRVDASAEERMRELYQTHARPLYVFLLGLTLGHRQAAEDLTQETLLRAWRSLDTLNADVSTLRPWLFTVARRLAIDSFRARRARPVATENTDPDELPSTDDTFERMLTAETVRRALPRLSPEHQQVLVEIYYRGRTAREIAELFGIPEGTVKSRVYYGLRALRSAIGAVGGDPS
jgi:RNA polymerase sigma-70 factor, ECF subfamily